MKPKYDSAVWALPDDLKCAANQQRAHESSFLQHFKDRAVLVGRDGANLNLARAHLTSPLKLSAASQKQKQQHLPARRDRGAHRRAGMRHVIRAPDEMSAAVHRGPSRQQRTDTQKDAPNQERTLKSGSDSTDDNRHVARLGRSIHARRAETYQRTSSSPRSSSSSAPSAEGGPAQRAQSPVRDRCNEDYDGPHSDYTVSEDIEAAPGSCTSSDVIRIHMEDEESSDKDEIVDPYRPVHVESEEQHHKQAACSGQRQQLSRPAHQRLVLPPIRKLRQVHAQSSTPLRHIRTKVQALDQRATSSAPSADSCLDERTDSTMESKRRRDTRQPVDIKVHPDVRERQLHHSPSTSRAPPITTRASHDDDDDDAADSPDVATSRKTESDLLALSAHSVREQVCRKPDKRKGATADTQTSDNANRNKVAAALHAASSQPIASAPKQQGAGVHVTTSSISSAARCTPGSTPTSAVSRESRTLFTPYTVEDYKAIMTKLQKQHVGGLGFADTDAQRRAREKKLREKEYGLQAARAARARIAQQHDKRHKQQQQAAAVSVTAEECAVGGVNAKEGDADSAEVRADVGHDGYDTCPGSADEHGCGVMYGDDTADVDSRPHEGEANVAHCQHDTCHDRSKQVFVRERRSSACKQDKTDGNGVGGTATVEGRLSSSTEMGDALLRVALPFAPAPSVCEAAAAEVPAVVDLTIRQPPPTHVIAARQRRQRALEYAKKVGVPEKVKSHKSAAAEVDAQTKGSSKSHQEHRGRGGHSAESEATEKRARLLADLEQMHLQKKSAVEAIRKQLRV